MDSLYREGQVDVFIDELIHVDLICRISQNQQIVRLLKGLFTEPDIEHGLVADRGDKGFQAPVTRNRYFSLDVKTKLEELDVLGQFNTHIYKPFPYF